MDTIDLLESDAVQAAVDGDWKLAIKTNKELLKLGQIRRHLLPSFTSYIIVDLVISFPYMVLSETALSFIGLGLKDPVNSLGVMLQNVTSADVLLNYQWYFIPVIFFIALVMAFVFVGDGLRDAADPYSDNNK